MPEKDIDGVPGRARVILLEPSAEADGLTRPMDMPICRRLQPPAGGSDRMIARKYLLSGRVQGVGFRYFTQRVAARHQVWGYVKNLEDGRVEALAQGPEKSVEAFKHDISAGPRYSRVDDVEEIVLEPNSELSSFRIER
jgi:acylphosphatase